MHSEDYVHRIGRTGRAHAVGDAISFVTNEDHGELRALERFIGRGIVRKKAEGFNYTAAAPAYNPAEEERHHSTTAAAAWTASAAPRTAFPKFVFAITPAAKWATAIRRWWRTASTKPPWRIATGQRQS